MALSDDEQYRLREIEALTAASDPAFASRLDLPAAVRRRRRMLLACWCVLAFGAVMMMAGAGAARGLISIGTVVAALGWTLMMWSVFAAWGLRTPKT